MPRTSRWANRNEEQRLRCRATEVRNGKRVQCSENRKLEHEHQWYGKPFAAGYSEPASGTPTLGPSSIGAR